jgi:hypothetical protein
VKDKGQSLRLIENGTEERKEDKEDYKNGSNKQVWP